MEKLYSFLYLCDLTGTSPQLLIFNNKRYKSAFTSSISLLIILFSIGFTIYSLIEYFKYESPNIIY
jgi:hypothetical protein